LGFVIPIVQKSGLNTILVGRHDPKANRRKQELYASLEAKKYFIRVYGENQNRAINIADFIYFNRDREKFIDIVANPDTVLLTTAVFDQGLTELAPLLVLSCISQRMIS
jgi:hypothetical protein